MGSNPTGTGDEVVAQAAHDLLNVINVIRSYTGIVQGQIEDASMAEYLERVQAAADKALDIAHHLQAIGDGPRG